MVDATEQSQFIPGVEAEALALEPNFLSRALDVGRNVMTGAQGMFNSARGVSAVLFSTGVAAVGVGGLAIEAPSALGDSQTSATTTALTEAQCETEALQQPANLQGHYQLKNPATNPNNHWYVESFTLPSVANCDALGKRVVSYFQEDNRDGGSWSFDLRTTDAGVLTSRIVPKINSQKFPAHATNGAKAVHGLYRAPNFCVDEGNGLHAVDAHGTLGRPAAQITWQPNDGSKPVSQIFHGSAHKLC